jgi:hypothetical protein
MKHAYIGAAVAAALSLAGISAHASCADPRTVSAQASLFKATPDAVLQAIVADDSRGFGTGFEPMVGTWLATYSAGGTAYAEAYIQWHGDGTEWENINFPVLQGNICMGSWKRIDENHFSRNHYGWLFNNGTLAGYFNETETDVLSIDGRHYNGQNTTTFFFSDGTSMTQSGTSSAVLLRN